MNEFYYTISWIITAWKWSLRFFATRSEFDKCSKSPHLIYVAGPSIRYQHVENWFLLDKTNTIQLIVSHYGLLVTYRHSFAFHFRREHSFLAIECKTEGQLQCLHVTLDYSVVNLLPHSWIYKIKIYTFVLLLHFMLREI